ncbi:MAG: WhiB family transcriptional regulator, partial [Geodermatophilaceae bacterium]
TAEHDPQEHDRTEHKEVTPVLSATRTAEPSVLEPAHGPSRSELPCRVQDPELWFAERPSDLEIAKSLCADCPARRACLAGALQRREPWGVWGGEIFDHGVVIARKRPRGRPRKEVAA